MAGQGMYAFLFVWILLVAFDALVWWRPAVPLFLSYISLLLIQAIVKRERPDFERISGYRMWIRTYSFPSGHATESTALAGSLFFYAQYPSLEVAVIAAIVLGGLAVLIMYSRIVIGVHYFFDVVGGFLLGSLYVLAFLLL